MLSWRSTQRAIDLPHPGGGGSSSAGISLSLSLHHSLESAQEGKGNIRYQPLLRESRQTLPGTVGKRWWRSSSVCLSVRLEAGSREGEDVEERLWGVWTGDISCPLHSALHVLTCTHSVYSTCIQDTMKHTERLPIHRVLTCTIYMSACRSTRCIYLLRGLRAGYMSPLPQRISHHISAWPSRTRQIPSPLLNKTLVWPD